MSKQSVLRNPAILAFILIVLSPFGAYSIGAGGGADLSLMNMYQVLLLPFFLVLFCVMRGRVPNITVVGWLHVLFMMVALVGTVFALDQMAAMRGLGAYFLKCFLAFIYCLYFLRTREDLETAAKLLLVMGLASAVMALIQLCGFFFFDKIIFPPFLKYFSQSITTKSFGFESGALGIPGFARSQGFFNQGANQYAAYMLVPFACALYFAAKYKRMFYYGIVVFLAVALFLSVSRNAYLGGMILVLFAYYFWRSKGKRVYPLVLRPYVVIAVFASILALFYFTRHADFYAKSEKRISETTVLRTPVSLIERLNPFLSASAKKSVSYFTEHFELAAVYGFENGGFGLGGENFDDYVYHVYPIKYGSHSNMIIFLGDNGIWGLLAQIAIVVMTIAYGLRAYYLQPPGERDHLPLFLTAAFCGLVITGVVRTYYLMPITFMAAGMIVRLHILTSRSMKAPSSATAS